MISFYFFNFILKLWFDASILIIWLWMLRTAFRRCGWFAWTVLQFFFLKKTYYTLCRTGTGNEIVPFSGLQNRMDRVPHQLRILLHARMTKLLVSLSVQMIISRISTWHSANKSTARSLLQTQFMMTNRFVISYGNIFYLLLIFVDG